MAVRRILDVKAVTDDIVGGGKTSRKPGEGGANVRMWTGEHWTGPRQPDAMTHRRMKLGDGNDDDF